MAWGFEPLVLVQFNGRPLCSAFPSGWIGTGNKMDDGQWHDFEVAKYGTAGKNASFPQEISSDGQRQTQRQTETETDIDRQRDGQRDKRQTETRTARQTDGQTDRQKERQRDRQTDRQTDRQIDRQTHKQTDR